MGEVVEVDSKRRIVIPSPIRNKFGLSEGAQLVVEIRDDGIALHKIATETPEKIRSDNLKRFLTQS